MRRALLAVVTAYSPRDAAHALGCSRSAWSNWEAGTVQVPLDIALAMGLRPYAEVQGS